VAKLPVKTELRLWSLHAMVASERFLVEGIVGAAFCLLICAALWENPRSWITGSGDSDLLCRSPSWGHHFRRRCWMVEVKGGVVFIYRVDDTESWQRGATGSR
jgi:hypothetical protein